MPRHKIGVAIAAGVIIGTLLAPAGADGTVTIGSNLARAINLEQDCGASACTFIQSALPSSSQAAGGVGSPVNGVITAWRIRTGAVTNQTALKVSRPLGGGLSTGAGTSASVIPPADSIAIYPTRLPIAIGDLIGLTCGGAPVRYFVDGGGTIATYQPVLADGGPGRAPNTTSSREIAVNAEIEPTSTFTIGKVKAGEGGKLTVTATLPNPGVLVGGDKRDAGLAAAATGKKRAKYLRRSSLQIGAAVTANLQVKPTKAARQVLASRGRLKTKLKLAFTPTGGSPSIQIVKVKLKD